ncbi:hypothetical protein B0H19DRAFT_1055520 [Mycena capillaripes]|nr:hypothetical protein B0H19DRAFT_1055520 [Mycena capillaripes]
MPIRQPLRDRCNVFLRVCTDRMPTSTKSKLPANLVSSAGNTPPTIPVDRRSQLSSPPPLPPLSPYVFVDLPDQENAPRQFIPYLYLSSPPSTTTLPAGSWTHVIRILSASEDHPAGSTSITEATPGSTQILNLYARPIPASSTALPLPRRHILVARDFLALALPYYSCAHPASTDSPDSPLDGFLLSPPAPQRCRTDAVRVLLMGPPRALLAIALTYIAYASECTVAHVMRCVVDEAEDTKSCELLGPDAQMGLGALEMQVLEKLAKQGL